MSGPTVKIEAAMLKRLAAMPGALPTEYENDTPLSDADKENPYQRPFLFLAEPGNPTAGTGFHRQYGYLQVSLFYPLGSGTGYAAEQAEALRAWFAQGTPVSEDGLDLTLYRTPYIAKGQRDGDRWMVVVKVLFFANVFEEI
jgi:hypothetical protein